MEDFQYPLFCDVNPVWGWPPQLYPDCFTIFEIHSLGALKKKKRVFVEKWFHGDQDILIPVPSPVLTTQDECLT